jgi:hypothetical protein
MTLVVAWYREKFGQLWVAADTRISGSPGIITDHGPKIFQVPILCRKLNTDDKTSRLYRGNYGFAFAGSTISALGTHALASACCQNLVAERKIDPPTVEDVANLYRKLADLQIREICSRTNPNQWQSFFFWGFVFGYCLLKKTFQLWVIESHLRENNFEVIMGELPVVPAIYYPMGSGKEQFIRMMDAEAGSGSGMGVFHVMNEMIVAGVESSVGGHLQVATVGPAGVEIPPVLILGDKPYSGNTTFLGVAVDLLGKVGGFGVGYRAVGPDRDEMARHAAQVGRTHE